MLRATADYTKLLYESYHPELWYFAEKRQAHFNWLLKAAEYVPMYRQLTGFEQQDLETGNIPAFYANSSTHNIVDANHNDMPIKVLLSGIDRVKHHIEQHINRGDLHVQNQLVRMSYEAAQMNEANVRVVQYWQPDAASEKTVTRAQLVSRLQAMSQQILDKVMAMAI